MTANANTRNEIEHSNDELNLVVGGISYTHGWDASTLANSQSPAAAVNLSAIQPIHLAPLPALHAAVPH